MICFFMQDGASPHFASTVRAWLDNHFPARWIGRRGPTEWPARGSLSDFFEGMGQGRSLQNASHSIDELEANIHRVISNVPLSFFKAATENVPMRLKERAHISSSNFCMINGNNQATKQYMFGFSIMHIF